MIVSAFAEYIQSMIGYGPASLDHRVPLRTYSNSWALDRQLFLLALRYVSMAMVASPWPTFRRVRLWNWSLLAAVLRISIARINWA
jgi:hypothetical protein